MTADDFIAFLPMILLAASAVVIMVVIAFQRSHGLAAALSLCALGVSGLGIIPALRVAPRTVGALLSFDQLSHYFTGLLLATAAIAIALSYEYMRGREDQREEYYVMVLLATLGAIVLGSSRHFASFFLGLEILSVSLYTLIGYSRSTARCTDAATKYLILAGASSAFLLFGMALVYLQTGTMEFGAVHESLQNSDRIAVMGAALIFVGLGFKLAFVPFHLWTPDVYRGAPAPVTAIVATVSKGGALAVLVRYMGPPNTAMLDSMYFGLAALAILSMIVGNLLALMERNVKRLLAYSSIAHFGYLLTTILAHTVAGVESIGYYLPAYFIAILIAFGIVTILTRAGEEPETIEAFRGLVWQRPFLGLAFAGSLLSLAGVPFTAGFVGKFYVLAATTQSELWALALVLVVTSAIGLFYYLRVVISLFSTEPTGASTPALSAGPAAIALGALCILLLALGIYPATLSNIVERVVNASF